MPFNVAWLASRGFPSRPRVTKRCYKIPSADILHIMSDATQNEWAPLTVTELFKCTCPTHIVPLYATKGFQRIERFLNEFIEIAWFTIRLLSCVDLYRNQFNTGYYLFWTTLSIYNWVTRVLWMFFLILVASDWITSLSFPFFNTQLHKYFLKMLKYV